QPSEGLGIDQERVADPKEAGDEVAEPEPPADQEAGRRAVPAGRRGAVDQPDHQGKGHEQHRPEMDRGHRQGRNRAGRECDSRTTPSPGEDDGLSQAEPIHGLAVDPADVSAAAAGTIDSPGSVATTNGAAESVAEGDSSADDVSTGDGSTGDGSPAG